MSQFRVTPADLVDAGSAVARGGQTLPAAAQSVSATSEAAQQTPAAGVYEALLSDAASVITTLETAVESLSRCLTTAGANYARVDSVSAGCLAPGQ